MENGTVAGFDIRTTSSNPSSEPKPSFTIHAHDKAVCAIAYNSLVPNVCVISSSCKFIRYCTMFLTEFWECDPTASCYWLHG